MLYMRALESSRPVGLCLMLPVKGGPMAPRAFCAASVSSTRPFVREAAEEAEGMPVGDMGSSLSCEGIREGGFRPEGFTKFCSGVCVSDSNSSRSDLGGGGVCPGRTYLILGGRFHCGQMQCQNTEVEETSKTC